MSMAELIGRNIQNLMEENSIPIIDLAKVIGVTRQTFSNYLNGESIIDSEKLVLLANYFSKPLEYFLEEEHTNLCFMFRASNPKENVDNIEKVDLENYMNSYFELFSLAGEQLSYIPEQYNLTVKYNSKIIPVDDPDLDFGLFKYKLPKDLDEVIESIAVEQRRRLGAEEEVGVELVRCLEDAGIRILYRDIDNNDLFGISAFHPEKGCFILINNKQGIPEERKLFTIAHEYGHLILHRQYYRNIQNSIDYGSKRNISEAMADAFAGYFLIPRALLKKYERFFSKPTISISDLIFIKKEFQVSLMSLVMSLHKYGYINDVAKKKIFDILYSKGYQKKEPQPCENLILKMNEKFEFMIKSLYLEDKLSISKVAELLSIPLTVARQQVKKWVNHEEEIQLTV